MKEGMKKERKIINTNIRFNLMEPDDLKAWEHLQHMNRKEYKSYSRAVVIAINDYFDRLERLTNDPYLETREKEDAFLNSIREAVMEGAKESVPFIMAKNLLEILQSALTQDTGVSHTLADENIHKLSESIAPEPETMKDDTMDDALDFADSF